MTAAGTADTSGAVLLVGMSVREVERRDELLALAREIDAGIAFLQVGDPSLAHTLTRLADAGHERVTLVGVSLGMLAPAASWLRRVAAYWSRERTGHCPEIAVAAGLVESLTPASYDEVVADVRPLSGREAGLTSAAWEDLPSYRHQVMVCRGPRCTAKGSENNLRALILGMLEHELGDDDVLLVHTGCQFPCNQAPVISVQPDDVWYGGLDPAATARVVTEHLVDGTPVDSHRLPRTTEKR